jgi:hypothetical protein
VLKQVLEEFEKSDGVLSLDEMAGRLSVERSVLEGMIEFWVRKGRLRQVGPDGGDCARCAGCHLASNVERARATCWYSQARNKGGKYHKEAAGSKYRFRGPL